MTKTRTTASHRYRCPTCGAVCRGPASLHCPRCGSPARSLGSDCVHPAGPSRERLFELFSPIERELYAAIVGTPPARRRDAEARSAA